MKTSDSIKEIATALSKAQSKITGAKADSKNPFFNSMYAKLDSCIDAIREAFAENGLSYFQSTSSLADKPFIETMIMHTSGEWLRSDPLELKCDNQNNPQKISAANTYYRRIQLCGMVGLAQVDDNDGNDLVKDPDGKEQQKPINKPPVQTSKPSEAQIKRFNAMSYKLKWSPEHVARFIQNQTEGLKKDPKELDLSEYKSFTTMMETAINTGKEIKF